MSSAVANELEQLQQFLQDRVAEIVGTNSSAISLNAALSSLGVDSLGLLHLIESVESELRIDVPHNVCLDRLTIQTLARSLAETGPCRPAVARDALSQIRADCHLPDDIRPAAVESPTVPRAILLTGATGFLGAFLVRSLLQKTEARLVCLVRPQSGDAETRLRQNLEQYRIWEHRFQHRITVLEADIAQPRLGLSPSAFDRLADEVDVVLHAAASVNWIQPYVRLRPANVASIRELLRLACRRRTKPFHFISSLAACYSTIGPREISENDDLIADVNGIHLAYAQSKCVAESLVRSAAQRGLAVSIVRPALISGDSVNGLSNIGDVVSALIKACVQMGAAPDLDWLLDLLPVDFAADAITRLTLDSSPKKLRFFHLANPKARHWRELILWMSLYGYDMQLIPYEQWLLLLKHDVRRSKDHPLRELLPFFSDRPDGQNGLYLPQLYEEPRRRKVRFDATREQLQQAGLRCPPLSTRLLDLCFESYINRSFLPRVHGRVAQADSWPAFDESLFRDITGTDVIRAELLEFAAANSVIGELTSWKYGRSIGLHRYRLQFARPSRECDVVVKVKARDTDVTAVGQTVASLCGSALGTAYQSYSDCLGLSECDRRELAMYRQEDARFRRFTPEFFGGKADEHRTVLILENVSGLEMMDSVDSIDAWDAGYIEAAIRGIAQLHAIHFGQLSSAHNDNRFVEASDLWTALAEHAAPIFSRWIGPEVRSVQAALLERATDIGTLRQRLPATWIHNDFNPRNLGFRRVDGELRLCAYDWELATAGLPQHDLAELLCFVLQAEVDEHALFHYIDLHRTELEAASGLRIDDSSWKLGFSLSLYDLMINRLPAYAMIHHFNKQRFLERVVRTWKGLFDVVSSTVSPLF